MKKGWRVFLLLVLFLAGVYLVMRLVKIEQFEVVGNQHNTKQEVLELAGFKEDMSLLDSYLHRPTLVEDKGYIARMLIDYPTLRTIKIQVVEKDIMGYVKYMDGYLCVDSQAYIIDDVTLRDMTVPLIKGIKIDNFNLNQSLDIDDSVKLTLLNIYKSLQTFGIQADTIDLNYNGTDDISLQCRQLTVKLGRAHELEKKLRLLVEILSETPVDKKGILHLEKPGQKIFLETTD